MKYLNNEKLLFGGGTGEDDLSVEQHPVQVLLGHGGELRAGDDDGLAAVGGDARHFNAFALGYLLSGLVLDDTLEVRR